MSTTIQRTTTLEIILCTSCGITFAAPDFFLEARRKTGDLFYCPNGHGRVYRESELDKARKEADQLRTQLTASRDQRNAAEAAADTARRSAAATRGHLTRERRRSAAGVCPCCHRSFKQVRAHMRGQHPDFVTEHLGANT
jgi:uncharacterized Zn finger protein (UPF0148 family)